MEFIPPILGILAVLAGGGQVAQIFLTRKIKALVLQGSRFHLAALPSGSVELRSGVRPDSMTQKEAANLATGLRALIEKVRWNPIFGLKLILGNHAGADGRSIEDSFAQVAIESQQRELIMLSEDRAISGAVPLIKSLSKDEDFEKLRSVLSAMRFGEEVPQEIAHRFKSAGRSTDLEPLVLWSSRGDNKPQAVAPTVQPLAATQQRELPEGHIADGEIPGMPGYRMNTFVQNKGASYAMLVVSITRGRETIATEKFYLNSWQDHLEAKTQSTKRSLIKQVQEMSAIGVG